MSWFGKDRNPNDKEKKEIAVAVNELNKLLENFETKNEAELLEETEKLIHSLTKVRNHYLTDIYGLVLLLFAALITKNTIAKVFDEDAYIDTIDRLKKVQNYLQSAVNHLDHSKNFKGEVHDEVYSEIYSLLAYNNICFRRFFQARRFAKKALTLNHYNEQAKALIILINENMHAENQLLEAFKKEIPLESIPGYKNITSKLALCFVDDKDNELKGINTKILKADTPNYPVDKLPLYLRINRSFWTMINTLVEKVKETVQEKGPRLALAMLTMYTINSADINANMNALNSNSASIKPQSSIGLSVGMNEAKAGGELTKQEKAYEQIIDSLNNKKVFPDTSLYEKAGFDKVLGEDFSNIFAKLPGNESYTITIANYTTRELITDFRLGGKKGPRYSIVFGKMGDNSSRIAYGAEKGGEKITSKTKRKEGYDLDWKYYIDGIVLAMKRENSLGNYLNSIEYGAKFQKFAKNWEFWNLYGDAYVNCKDIDKGRRLTRAIEIFNKAVAIDNQHNAEPLLNLGLAYFHISEFKKSIYYFNEVLKYHSNHKRALKNKAYVLDYLKKNNIKI